MPSLLDQAQSGISQSGATSLLVAAGGEVAARIAHDAGEPDCEARTQELAQSQWVALRHPRASQR